jgi:hypothetical protein
MSKTTRQMSDSHENFLVKMLGGRRTKGSGNQFNNQMDGRHAALDEPWAFAWDGKSTFGKSVGVTREMWDKAIEQSHGERPMLALRWYADERFRDDDCLDLAVISMDDLVEMREEIITLRARVYG